MTTGTRRGGAVGRQASAVVRQASSLSAVGKQATSDGRASQAPLGGRRASQAAAQEAEENNFFAAACAEAAAVGPRLLRHRKELWEPKVRDDALLECLQADEVDMKLVRHLVKAKGPNKNAREQVFGWCPVHFAAHRGNAKALELLIVARAGPRAKDRRDNGIMHLAARGGHAACTGYLLAKGAEFNAKNADGWTPLSLGAMNGHASVVEALLGVKANVETVDKDGRTPAMWAARGGHCDVMKLLLEQGFDLSRRDEDSNTVADHAREYLEVRSALRQVADASGALLGAAQRGDVRAARQALQEGAYVNVQDELGWTPLTWSAMHHSLGLVQLLAQHLADPSAVEASAEVIQDAGLGKQEERQELLRVMRRSFDCKDRMLAAAKASDWGAVRAELDIGGVISASEEGTQLTCLMCAVVHCDVEAAAMLLERKAPPDQRDAVGWTAAHFAVQTGSVELVSALWHYGLDFKVAAHDGSTCQHVAARGDDGAMVQLLAEAQASVNAATVVGATPLHVAVLNASTGALAALLVHRADVGVRDVSGRPLLTAAAAHGHACMVLALLGPGRPPVEVDRHGVLQSPELAFSRAGSKAAAEHVVSRVGSLAATEFAVSRAGSNASAAAEVQAKARGCEWEALRTLASEDRFQARVGALPGMDAHDAEEGPLSAGDLSPLQSLPAASLTSPASNASFGIGSEGDFSPGGPVGRESSAAASSRPARSLEGAGRGPKRSPSEWAQQYKPGRYVVVKAKVAVEDAREPGSGENLCTLQRDDVVRVLEVVHVKAAKRLRGRLKVPENGWLSLVNTETGNAFVEKVQTDRHTLLRRAVELHLELAAASRERAREAAAAAAAEAEGSQAAGAEAEGSQASRRASALTSRASAAGSLQAAAQAAPRASAGALSAAEAPRPRASAASALAAPRASAGALSAAEAPRPRASAASAQAAPRASAGALSAAEAPRPRASAVSALAAPRASAGALSAAEAPRASTGALSADSEAGAGADEELGWGAIAPALCAEDALAGGTGAAPKARRQKPEDTEAAGPQEELPGAPGAEPAAEGEPAAAEPQPRASRGGPVEPPPMLEQPAEPAEDPSLGASSESGGSAPDSPGGGPGLDDEDPWRGSRSSDAGESLASQDAGTGAGGEVHPVVAEEDEEEDEFETPLVAATLAGHRDVVELLLELRAPPDATDGEGQTPLMLAVSAGSFELVEALLAAGADPEAVDLEGRTPLSLAPSEELRVRLRWAALAAGGDPLFAPPGAPPEPGAEGAGAPPPPGPEGEGPVDEAEAPTVFRLRMEGLSPLLEPWTLEAHAWATLQALRPRVPLPSRLEVVLHEITGRPRGHAYLDFGTREEAAALWRWRELQVAGRRARLVEEGRRPAAAVPCGPEDP